MMRLYPSSMVGFLASFLSRGLQVVAAAADPFGAEAPTAVFRAPAIPPEARYAIESRLAIVGDHLKIEGVAEVHLRNMSAIPLRRLAVEEPEGTDASIRVAVDGQVLPLAPSGGGPDFVFDLPEAILPGGESRLRIEFATTRPLQGKRERVVLTEWHPRLWWGLRTHDDFELRLEAPPGYAVATSGRWEGGSGRFHAEGARSFGLFLGRDLRAAEEDVEGVLVRCLFTEAGEPCARFLLATAVDAIRFYRGWLGFYPYRTLTIVPGMDRPAGGYPVATSVVAVHGQERMAERPETHWRWIAAHEIGHQYWGEWVLEKDDPDWLWIGLGIYADREYMRARGLGLEAHREVLDRYTTGRRAGLDATLDRPPEQLAGLDFDYNNVVRHGKGFAVASALAAALGKKTFERAYRRALREYGERRLGAAEFRALCEAESGEDLGWFFEAWARSNRYLSYEIESKECAREGDRYRTRVRVRRTGTLSSPVPLAADFADGSRQVKFVDRLLAADVVEFTSASPLEEARLDPDGECALVVPPPSPTAAELRRRLAEMPWTGAGREALELFRAAREGKWDREGWFGLGLRLFDGAFYEEALEAFERSSEGERLFASCVWKGHVLDLLGRRDQAVECYGEALRRDEGRTIRHDQYGIRIDRKWVEERLRTPFRRR